MNEDTSNAEKDYIRALEDMEMKLLREAKLRLYYSYNRTIFTEGAC